MAAITDDGQAPALPGALESAVRAHVPQGERIVWLGRPSAEHAVQASTDTGWQRAAILGGGYSLLIGTGAAWISGDVAWIALPALWLTVCGFGLLRQRRRLQRLAEVLEHTAYALTVRHAFLVRSKPSVEVQSVPLSDVEPVQRAGRHSAVSHLVLSPAAGAPAVVFSDLEDAASVQRLVKKLKEAPEAMEQQYALLEYWARMRESLG